MQLIERINDFVSNYIAGFMKTYLTVLFAYLLCACTPKAGDIVLTFDVQDKTTPIVAVVYGMTVNELTLDEHGHAEFVLKNTDALYANVFYGMEKKQIYLEKGDRLNICFNGKDFSHTVVFEGEKAPVMDYLNSITILPLTDEDYGMDFQDFVKKMQSKELEYIKLLQARNLDGYGKFVKMEKGRLKYAFGSALLMYPTGHVFVSQDTAYKAGEEYYAEVQKWMVEDEDWLDLKEYRDFMCEAAHTLDVENRDVTTIYGRIVGEMKYIAEHIKSDRVKQVLLNALAGSYVDQFGIRDIEELENIYKTYVRDSLLIADYQKKYDRWDISSPGRLSPDFEAKDINGKIYSLESFKGKYVYIDLWATWCGPCQRELPFMRQLAEKFNGKNIIFLGLSIDHNVDSWKEKVKSGDLVGVQLLLGRQSAFQKAYNIDGIPRFILLDPDGRIINNNMTPPSSADTEITLNDLSGI